MQSTKDDVMAAAIAYASEKGWPWEPPIEIRFVRKWLRPSFWSVRTNLEQRGCNINIKIDDRSLEILEAMFSKR